MPTFLLSSLHCDLGEEAIDVVFRHESISSFLCVQERHIVPAGAKAHLEVSSHLWVAREHCVEVFLAHLLLHAVLDEGRVLAVASATAVLNVQKVLSRFFAKSFFG